VLARAMRSAMAGGSGDNAAIAAAMRTYEAERTRRVARLTARAYVLGALLQLPFPPVSGPVYMSGCHVGCVTEVALLFCLCAHHFQSNSSNVLLGGAGLLV
jgi:hypothetical protein